MGHPQATQVRLVPQFVLDQLHWKCQSLKLCKPAEISPIVGQIKENYSILF